jgi:hypothetical protein
VGRSECNRLFERRKFKWEDNIKMRLQDVAGGTYWVDLSQDRKRWRAFVNKGNNLRVP